MTLSNQRIDELLNRARTGDETAKAALIAGMRERIYRWALVMTGDTDDADDVAQQVSVAVHRRVSDFEARSRFTTWLYVIVRNAAIEFKRRSARRAELSIDDDSLPELSAPMQDQIETLHDARRVEVVRAFFNELPARQREVIELVDLGGHSAVEAAEMLGVEPETARVHLLRARRTLRTKMLQQHPEMFDE